MISGNTDIEFIQGDTYQKNIEITGIEQNLIEGVYISCRELDLCKKLPYDSSLEKYVFKLEASETALLKNVRTTYDITIKFIRDVVKTVSYKSFLQVLPKINKVRCMNNE